LDGYGVVGLHLEERKACPFLSSSRFDANAYRFLEEIDARGSGIATLTTEGAVMSGDFSAY
jgi:hypothetical protein